MWSMSQHWNPFIEIWSRKCRPDDVRSELQGTQPGWNGFLHKNSVGDKEELIAAEMAIVESDFYEQHP